VRESFDRFCQARVNISGELLGYDPDAPTAGAEWVKYNVIVKKGSGGAMEVEKRAKPEGPPHLVAIANAKIEDLESGKVGADEKA